VSRSETGTGETFGRGVDRLDAVPLAAIRRCWSYSRTKYVVPLNWSFYRGRHGIAEGLKAWRHRRKEAAKRGYRSMYFRDCAAPLREFIRVDPWELPYLVWAAARAQKGIVEIGRYNGGSTLVFALANTKVPIHSIDIAPQDDELLRRVLADHGVGDNVHLLVGDSQRGEFSEIAPGSYDLLLIDGDHSYEGCLADLTKWWPGLAEGGGVLLHDCYHGSEVQEAADAFFAEHRARFIRGTNIPAAHWLTAEGSLAHAIKA
jgi:predicted O-methyltransferase YrrM